MTGEDIPSPNNIDGQLPFTWQPWYWEAWWVVRNVSHHSYRMAV